MSPREHRASLRQDLQEGSYCAQFKTYHDEMKENENEEPPVTEAELARIAELERRVEELTEELASATKAGGYCRVNVDYWFKLRSEVERLTKERDQAKREWAEDFEVRTHLLRERDEARAWQAEIRDAIQRSGMGIMRTSQGPSGTMLGYRPEVEEEHNRKTLEVIHENVDLAAEVRTLKTKLAEREEDRWQPIETAPKDGSDVLLSNTYWVFEATSLPDGRFFRTKDGQQTAPGNCRFWQSLPKPPAIRAARAQSEDGK